MPKRGLVLEGGAMKGLFTCGVLDVFMENGITFDGAVGVSAGAVFGCNYKSGQIGRPIRYNKKYCKNKEYASLSNVLKTGDMYGVDFCYRKLPFELDIWDDEAFRNNEMKFYSVSTDLETGKANYHLCDKGKDEDLEWFRASASVPLVSNIVNIDGGKYLDGGIADSIPLKFFEHLKYERIVVITTKPIDYRKKKSVIMNFLSAVVYRKYPEFVKAMCNRYLRYNKTVEYILDKESKGDIFVIRPPEKLKVKGYMNDPEDLEYIYQLGRKEGENRLEKMKEFLELS